ncbi:Uncharacterized protein APZ42_003909 [Daphnia magna]|uniref:Uncharacterized protein n=1 Tax=Daphnia magna TaxID=35525 RepID=A0A164HD95_9CRUS|nr:Uncharacterized protein APZ42_003909 [Daphnia magna]
MRPPLTTPKLPSITAPRLLITTPPRMQLRLTIRRNQNTTPKPLFFSSFAY